MKSHGSGAACQDLRINPRCDECKAYFRERMRARRSRVGSPEYNVIHNIDGAANKFNNYRRSRIRNIRNDEDALALAELEAKWQS